MTALRYSKKGQMGVMELFMIIFVLFIIIGLGMYYFYKFSMSSTKETAEETCIQSTAEQLSSILNLPEIRCSIQAHGRECVDVTKLMAFKDSPSVTALSRGSCKKSITFIQVYPPPPEGKEDINCTQQTWPDECGKWLIYEPSAKVQREARVKPLLETPVSLYYPTQQQFKIGKLQLRLFQK